jgi:hypothetical protein
VKTSSAKAKGRRLQQEVREAILGVFPELHPDDVKAAVMGESGLDIHLSPAAQARFPFAVECKNVERLNVWAAIEQAEKNRKGALRPLVVFRRNRSRTYAVIELTELLSLLS